jgi:hypothetical protein
MSPLILPQVSIERTLKFIFLGICVLFFAWYTYFQARNLIHGPAISLYGEIDTIQSERFVTLKGNARNVVILRLNGREIHTDERGDFEQALVLENGYTIMSLEAEDRYGRVMTLTRSFMYKPETTLGYH